MNLKQARMRPAHCGPVKAARRHDLVFLRSDPVQVRCGLIDLMMSDYDRMERPRVTLRLPMATALAAFGFACATGAALALPAQTTSELNVRVGPSSDTTVLYTLEAREIVEILSCGSGWCKLDTGGFVSEAYLTSAGESEPVLPAAPATPQAPSAPIPSPPSGYSDDFPVADTGGNWRGAPFDAGPPPPSAYGWTGTVETRVAETSADGWQGWEGARSFLDVANDAFDDFADVMDPYDTAADPYGAGGYDPGFTGFETVPDPSPRQYGFHDEPEHFPFAFGIESITRPPACFYDRIGYDGRGFCRFRSTVVTQFPGWWDDRITSIYLRHGWAVQVCTGPDFTGYCQVFTESTRWVRGALDNQITSYRLFRR